LAQVAEKRRVIFSEMVQAEEPLSTRSLNCLGFDRGGEVQNERADFYLLRMSLNGRDKGVEGTNDYVKTDLCGG
jgi:hypothetical protein